MSDILYERATPNGAVVRIRRTTPPGAVPVCAVLELDRRIGDVRGAENPGTVRSDAPTAPSLLETSAPSEAEVRLALEPYARDDAIVARLMQVRGLR